MTSRPPVDELIDRLRDRAADPERRTSTRPSQFSAGIRTVDLGSLIAMGRSLAASLSSVVSADRQGRIDEAAYDRALDLQRQMETPAATVLPAPADDEAIADAERRFGHALPAVLRRVYAEVADGGFGPGEGLLALDAAVAQYEELRSPGMMPRGRAWPDGLLPLVSLDPGWECVDATSGAVVAWDPEDLSEHSSERTFARSFSERFATVEAWLWDWVGSKTQAEGDAEMMARALAPEANIATARQAREMIGRMRLEERRAMGLPDVGWEAVVWGGLGWDPDEARSDEEPTPHPD